jgi:ACS family glucarate transporter-like MFS transporter
LPEAKETRIRYLIICILFVVSCFSFADRSALSQAASMMPKEMDLTP